MAIGLALLAALWAAAAGVLVAVTLALDVLAWQPLHHADYAGGAPLVSAKVLLHRVGTALQVPGRELRWRYGSFLRDLGRRKEAARFLVLDLDEAADVSAATAAAVPARGLGALEGFVRLVGPEVPEPTRVENTTDPGVCGESQTLEDLLVSEGRGIRNVIVALEDVPGVPTPPPARLVLDNRECRFVPHVSVLTVGSTIETTNSDPLLHTTHLYGAVKANIALPSKGLAVEKTAARPGMIVVKCDSHGWMQAFIRVDTHPFHAVTDPDGHFRIPDIPAGSHDLEIWHEKLGRQRKTIRIEAGKTKHIDVEYALKD